MRVFGRAAAMPPSPPAATRAAVVQREPRDPTATGDGDRALPGLRNSGRTDRRFAKTMKSGDSRGFDTGGLPVTLSVIWFRHM